MNEIHDHKQELRSSSELLANLHESGKNEEGKVHTPQNTLFKFFVRDASNSPFNEWAKAVHLGFQGKGIGINLCTKLKWSS